MFCPQFLKTYYFVVVMDNTRRMSDQSISSDLLRELEE